MSSGTAVYGGVKSYCSGKFKHRERASAIGHAKNLERSGKGRYAVYLCPRCGFWHCGGRKPDHVGKMNRLISKIEMAVRSDEKK